VPELTFRAPHGEVPGYLAVPSVGAGPWPGVVVIHEAFGLNADVRGKADQLAAHGYLALAPDLFERRAWIRCVRSAFTQIRAGSGPAFETLDAARSTLAGRADCTGHTGVIGFCMGGGFALLVARDGFDAASVNYGRLPGRQEDLVEALRGACPVVANYGGADKSLKGAAARLEAALDQLGIEHSVKEFPGAGHSFLNDEEQGPALLRPLMRVMGVGPHPESSPEAWQRIEDHFAKYLRD
jgi:carboxymethylenebutenolidase